MLKVNHKKCTGCAACQNICPKDCIILQEDDEGFRYPQVATDKCIDCGLCEKVCPVDDNKIRNRNLSVIPKSYSTYSRDEEVSQ